MPIHNTDWVQVVQLLLCRVTSSSKISCSSEANSSELITKARYFYTTQWITVRSNWREMWSRLVWSGGGSNCGGGIITGFSIWWANQQLHIFHVSTFQAGPERPQPLRISFRPSWRQAWWWLLTVLLSPTTSFTTSSWSYEMRRIMKCICI